VGRHARHWFNAPRRSDGEKYRRAIAPGNLREEYHAAGVPIAVAGRVVYRTVRVAVDANGAQWYELRPVADQRTSAPVGEPVPAHPLLALLRSSRVQDLARRLGLVAVDDT
jgi:hypothetical protein